MQQKPVMDKEGVGQLISIIKHRYHIRNRTLFCSDRLTTYIKDMSAR